MNYVFELDRWYINKDGDWDADFTYLIISDGLSVTFMPMGTTANEVAMKKVFPQRIMCGWFSIKRGTVNKNANLDKMETLYPHIYKELSQMYVIKDFRR